MCECASGISLSDIAAVTQSGVYLSPLVLLLSLTRSRRQKYSSSVRSTRSVGAAHPTTERGSSLDHLFAVSVIADLAAIKRGKAMAKTCIVLPADMKRILEFSNGLVAAQSHQPSRFIP